MTLPQKGYRLIRQALTNRLVGDAVEGGVPEWLAWNERISDEQASYVSGLEAAVDGIRDWQEHKRLDGPEDLSRILRLSSYPSRLRGELG